MSSRDSDFIGSYKLAKAGWHVIGGTETVYSLRRGHSIDTEAHMSSYVIFP